MKNIILALVDTYDRHGDEDQKYYYSAAEPRFVTIGEVIKNITKGESK